jgi:hypothetical protein
MCRLTVLEAHTLVGNPAIQAQMINYTKVGRWAAVFGHA